LICFSWQALPSATSYRLLFTLPTGAQVSFDTPNTSLTRYIESFTLGGRYTWQVTALDASGAPLCASLPFAFEKPAYTPPPTQRPKKDDGSNGGSGAGTDDSDDWDDDSGPIDG